MAVMDAPILSLIVAAGSLTFTIGGGKSAGRPGPAAVSGSGELDTASYVGEMAALVG